MNNTTNNTTTTTTRRREDSIEELNFFGTGWSSYLSVIGGEIKSSRTPIEGGQNWQKCQVRIEYFNGTLKVLEFRGMVYEEDISDSDMMSEAWDFLRDDTDGIYRMRVYRFDIR